jgi:hypothetical protein
MAEKDNTFGEIKKAIIGVVTLAITTAGGLFIANMEKIIGGDEDVKQEIVSDPFEQKESSKDTIVVIKKETPVVAKPEPQEKKEFEW